MMTAVLIDDEPTNNQILNKMLCDYCPEITVIGMAGNCRSGLSLIKEKSPDIVFLDIEMPYGNAFDMLDKLQPWHFDVIFVTAFDAYALKAVKYNALDYLLKPVDIAELKMSVEKAIGRKRMKHSQVLQLQNLLKNISNPDTGFTKLAIPSKDSLLFVAIDDIVRCEANAGYTLIYLKDSKKIVSTKNIKEYEEMLPETVFIRVHNSHLVNINFISMYHKGRGGYIEMEDGTVIEVATRRKDELFFRLGFKK